MLTLPVFWCSNEVTRGNLDYWTPDNLAAFAAQNGMALRGHTLVYEVCLPQWLTDGLFSSNEMAQILRARVQTTVSRYRGRVQVWDVVNEAVADGSPADALMLWGKVPVNRNAFSRALGPEYIEMAFRWAHEADPSARLFYNDYGIEGTTEKANRVYELVRGLLQRGVPIHGVGFQTHTSIYSPPNEADFTASLARIAGLGLEVQITEADVNVNERPNGLSIPLPLEPELSRRLSLQADVYASAMRACLRVPRCTGFTTWGVGDAHTWLDTFRNPSGVKTAPLLFNTSYAPKPAYRSLYDLLASRPRR